MTLKRKVDSLGLFSSNEDLDEVSTKSLKFFLVSYFEGYFRMKLHDRNPTLDTLKEINRYNAYFVSNNVLTIMLRAFLNYLKILNDYGMCQRTKSPMDPRQAKIELFRREKTLNQQMETYEKEKKAE